MVFDFKKEYKDLYQAKKSRPSFLYLKFRTSLCMEKEIQMRKMASIRKQLRCHMLLHKPFA